MQVARERPASDDILVSCLCVTENREAFIPWLLWCFDRQTWRRRELLIIDSSDRPLVLAGERTDVRVLHVQEGTSVPAKRNLAMREATGDIITWFDDDDWQHPRKLERLVEALNGGQEYAGSCCGWFVDLAATRCARYQGPGKRIIFNSAGFRRDAVRPFRFREDLRRAADTHWMRAIAAHYLRGAVRVDADDLFFWLSHDHNLSNPSSNRQFPHPLERLKAHVGADGWRDTDEQLEGLRRRTGVSQCPPTRYRTGSTRFTPAKGRYGSRADGRSDDSGTSDLPSVAVMIKATVLDAPSLDVMVRHMIAQARYSFAERTIIVDRPAAFTGKFATRARGSDEELNRVLEGLLQDRIIDSVREVDTRPEVVERTTGTYFPAAAGRVPTHAAAGSAIYATLFGLESMSTDYVLQMDADVLFHTGPESWVVRALQCMQADPNLWLMMTHPGPPAGPVGRSLGAENRGKALWDSQLGVWRFRHATTRYFLCDRRLLRGRLQLIENARGCVHLEQLISHAMRQNNAFRGNLGNLQSWHVHVSYHGDPFPAWASGLARAVEAGAYPAIQQGRFDLRLDSTRDREQWKALLGSPVSRRVSIQQNASPMVNQVQNVPVSAVSPVTVVIPVRDRAGQRLRNTLRSLQWQSAGRPGQVLVVSHGSRPEVDRDLEKLCREEAATLIRHGRSSAAWNKSLTLNIGIRAAEQPMIMTMDADVILAPDFLSIVIERLMQVPPALVLCRLFDLPRNALVPANGKALLASFDRLRAITKLRFTAASGGIQAASRSFFHSIRGYDEDLAWWGAMDGDVLIRARLMGLELDWIEDRTAMLHQWHPRKFANLTQPGQIRDAQLAWKRNHDLVQARRNTIERNPNGWGVEEERWASALAI